MVFLKRPRFHTIIVLVSILMMNEMNICQAILQRYILMDRIASCGTIDLSERNNNNNHDSLTSGKKLNDIGEDVRENKFEEWRRRGILEITIEEERLNLRTTNQNDNLKDQNQDDWIDVHQNFRFKVSSFNRTNHSSSSSSNSETWLDPSKLSYQIALISDLHLNSSSIHQLEDFDPFKLIQDPQVSITSVPLSCLLSSFEERFKSDNNQSKRIREYINIWMRKIDRTSRRSTTSIKNNFFLKDFDDDEKDEDDKSKKKLKKSEGLKSSQSLSEIGLDFDLLGIQWSLSSSSSSSSPSSSSSSFSSSFSSSSIICSSLTPSNSNSHSISSNSLHQFLDLLLLHSNLNILVRNPEKLIEPILKRYPIENVPEYLPDGRIKEQVPEKSWISKYWMYILPIVVLLLLGGGPPPEEGNAPDQSTNN